jgi:hypothetical protein
MPEDTVNPLANFATLPIEPIARDAFWDNNTFKHGSGLDPAKYHSPAEERVLGGQPMTAVIPDGVWGTAGTIVRRSTEDGAPIGHNPDAVATRVIVDPDIRGQGFVFDPTQIRKEQMAAAVVASSPRQSTSIEDRRFRASNVFRQFAIAEAPAMPVPEIRRVSRISPINIPGQYVVPEATDGGGQRPMDQLNDPMHNQPPALGQGVSTAAVVPRNNSQAEQQLAVPQWPSVPQQQFQNAPIGQLKAATFDLPMQQQSMIQPQWQAGVQQPPVQPPQTYPPPPTYPTPAPWPQQQAPSLFQTVANQPREIQGQLVKPPAFKVEFEIYGVPFKQEAFYHQIIRSDANLVLVFDRRAVGFPRNFPTTTDADMAVQISGQDVIYRTQTTGIHFPFLDYDLCVLLIKSEHPIPVAEPVTAQMPALQTGIPLI